MDGLFFYWISWLIWIIVTFLRQKDRTRNILAFCLLVIITLSNKEIVIESVTFNCSLLFIYLGALIMVVTGNNKISVIFKSFCIVFGYVGLLFWEQISPVWVVFPRTVTLSLIGFITLTILSGNFKEKCTVWLLGMTNGEILHGMILQSYEMTESIGEFAFLDLLLIEIGLLIVVHYIIVLKNKLDQYSELIEKQKKRWTS
ncbi:YphA family membrane protein [Aquibacillus kalidii]|uniref:YphA family membrane protein n=1 Tax=Aquibacillus kalidii TaxID=2762597 RepID=UPI0016471757|nr:hypothetical protein [Aquibacillus kalidii]